MTKPFRRTIQLAPDDTVALVLHDIVKGQTFADDQYVAATDVPSGHKVAIRDMRLGDPIIKYGQVIGIATQPIAVGEHVHVHNVSSEVTTRRNAAPLRQNTVVPVTAHFDGCVREDGRVGTRNFVGILTTVNCSATVARKIASRFPDTMFEGDDTIDGVVAITHSTGCGMAAKGEGADTLRRTLAGYLRHPNFGGILLIGLGCEVNQIDDLMAFAQLDKSAINVETLTIQEAGGTLAAIEQGTEIVRSLIECARHQKRTVVPACHLVLGLQCGGSDGWSGVTANPSLGKAADLLVAAGGTVILSETPEIYGAEQLLLQRAVSDDVRQKLLDRVEWWKDYVAKNGAVLNNNPSPGNIRGGLTTIFEKSLGAVAKSGASPLNNVYLYGEPIKQSGFVFMDSPGYDPCSATGQMASGANILAFTTGRGSVFGSKPAPCIKLSSNARLALSMSEDMDFDCSPVLDGTSLDEMGHRIFQLILQTASGARSKSEELGVGDLEFVPWQMGAVV